MLIAVFDDQKKDREKLVQIISRWGDGKGYKDIFVHQFSEINGLQFTLDNYRQPDVFFLDIMTPESRSAGFILGEKIHALNPQARIIFTTNSSEYITNAFEISAFRYLLKPLNPDKVTAALDQIYASFHQKAQHMAIFRGFGKQRIVDYDEVVRIAASTKAHLGTVYLIDGTSFEISLSSVTELIEKTLSNDFVRCHQSHIINMNHITAYDSHYVTLRDGTAVPISRGEKAAFLSAVIEHYKKDY